MFMQVKVLLLCRHSAADMALGFIDIQNPPHLRGQRGINFPQALHAVFVNGAFAHAKLLGCLAHGCVGCYDIICDLDGSLLNIILQGNPPIVVFLQCMREYKKCMYRYASSKTNLILKFYFDFYFNHTPLPFFWIFLLNFIHIIVTWRLFLFQNISIKPAFPGQAHWYIRPLHSIMFLLKHS